LRLPEERAADAAARWTVVPPRARHPVSSPTSGYQVRPGDTLGAIALRLRVPLPTLLKANGLRPSAVIRPGQLLALPGTADRGL
jgi:LysM repeat protein